MRLPKLPIRRDTDDLDDIPEPSEQQPAPVPGAAAAAGYRQVALPSLPPPPLSADLTKSIRFTISQPQGYYFEQVETFVKQVIETLAYHEQAEYLWQQAAYELQIELDQQAYDLQRVRSEIELFKVQGSPLVNPDGSYVTESQQATAEAMMADLTAANEALAAAQAALAQRDVEVARLQDLTSAKDQEITSLRAWGEEVLADSQSLYAQVAALTAAEGSQNAEQQDPDLAEVPAQAPEAHAEEPDADGSATAALAVGVPTVGLPAVTVASPEDFDGDDYDGDESDEDYDDAQYEPERAAEETSVETGEDLDAGPASDTADPAEDRTVVLDPTAVDESEQVEHAAEPQPDEPVVVAEPDPQFVSDPDAESIVGVEEATDASGAGDVLGAAEPDGEVDTADAVEASGEIEAGDPEPVSVSEADAEAVEDGEYDPYAEYDRAVSEDPSAPSYAVVPVDSELPEGVALPGTGEAVVSYPPAAPDIPLDTRGVPVEVWAPELNPELLNAAIEGDRTRDIEPETDAPDGDGSEAD